jgi:hypothetical protein
MLSTDDAQRGDPQSEVPALELAADAGLADAQHEQGPAQSVATRKIYLPVAYAANTKRAPALTPTPRPSAPSPAPTARPTSAAPAPAPQPPSTPPSSDAPCTIQVSADGQRGTVSIYTAVSQAVPGSVICMLGGTNMINCTVGVTKSGRADAYIVIRAADANRINMVWDPNTNVRTRGISMINFYGANAAYWEVRDLHLNASNQANAGVFCRGGHHIRVINTTIQNGDEAGFSTVGCDYLTAINNHIHRGGYGRGWSSGITFNKGR